MTKYYLITIFALCLVISYLIHRNRQAEYDAEMQKAELLQKDTALQLSNSMNLDKIIKAFRETAEVDTVIKIKYVETVSDSIVTAEADTTVNGASLGIVAKFSLRNMKYESIGLSYFKAAEIDTLAVSYDSVLTVSYNSRPLKGIINNDYFVPIVETARGLERSDWYWTDNIQLSGGADIIDVIEKKPVVLRLTLGYGLSGYDVRRWLTK